MKFQGKEGLIWFTGIVEDRNDPLFLNRVRVRIYGNHTHDKQLIATPDLPWSDVMMPTTSPSLSGLGTTTHSLVEGSTIVGFYRDAEQLQDPVVMGSFIGTPQNYYRIDEKLDEKGNRNFQKILRKTTDGFNDPRLDSEASYEGTPDGKNPKHINRNYGLTLALDKSPRKKGETKGEIYPKESYISGSDVNLLARATDYATTNYNPVAKIYPILNVDEETLSIGEGATDDDDSLLNIQGEKPLRDTTTYLKPKYPFNWVHESESGHIIEVDDTPDYERIHLYHKSGTRIEIDKDGNRVDKITKNKYTVVAADDWVTITGNVNVNVDGVINVFTKKDTFINTTGNTVVNTLGKTDIISKEDATWTAPNTFMTTNLKVDGTVWITGEQTNDSTITAVDEITGKEVKLSEHTHTETGSETNKPS
jgi:hypothetical protein